MFRGAKPHAQNSSADTTNEQSASANGGETSKQSKDEPVSSKQLFSTMPHPPVTNMTAMASRVRRIVRRVKTGKKFDGLGNITIGKPANATHQKGIVDKSESSKNLVEAHAHEQPLVVHKASTSVTSDGISQENAAVTETATDATKSEAASGTVTGDKDVTVVEPSSPAQESVVQPYLPGRLQNFEWSWAGVTKFLNQFFLEAPAQN